MISPELLRRYPFFAPYSEEQLRNIAMLADEEFIEPGALLFEEHQPADHFYLLMEGNIDLYFKAETRTNPAPGKEFSCGEINPGEVFGLSALIKPYILNASARTSNHCRMIRFDAMALRDLMQKDPHIGIITMEQIAMAVMERLAYTRVQLAAAWA